MAGSWLISWAGGPAVLSRAAMVTMHSSRRYFMLLALLFLLWNGAGKKANLDPAVVARMGLKRAKRLGEVGARGGGTDCSSRIGTPEAFRNLLVSMAETAITRR